MLTKILNTIHFIGLFVPQLIFFIPYKYYAPIFKWLIILYLLIPLHWRFFNGKCCLSEYTKRNGGLQNTKTSHTFTEVFMKWLYKPIMDIIGWEWNDAGITNMIYVHWIIIYLCLWFFIFFYAPKRNINILNFKCNLETLKNLNEIHEIQS